MLFATHILEENMKLYEIFEMMKAKYFDAIVFIKSGKFYVVYDNDAKYSPPGIKTVTIYGNGVFETSERKYQNGLNKCLTGVK